MAARSEPPRPDSDRVDAQRADVEVEAEVDIDAEVHRDEDDGVPMSTDECSGWASDASI